MFFFFFCLVYVSEENNRNAVFGLRTERFAFDGIRKKKQKKKLTSFYTVLSDTYRYGARAKCNCSFTLIGTHNIKSRFFRRSGGKRKKTTFSFSFRVVRLKRIRRGKKFIEKNVQQPINTVFSRYVSTVKKSLRTRDFFVPVVDFGPLSPIKNI